MLFKEVIGHTKLKSELIKIVCEGKVAHANILQEDYGTGGLAIAIAMSQYISCENKQEEDSCGECKSCIKYNKLVHPDLHFSFPVNSTKSIKADKKPISNMFLGEWREAIISNPYLSEQDFYRKIEIENKVGNIGVNEAHSIIKALSLKAFESEYKIMIIWLPERMNQEASNKLLKLIEEPPAKTIFFLVTQSKDKIISTILSRCRLIKIPPIEIKDLAEKISSTISSISQEEANLWAKISRKSYGRFLDKWKEENESSIYKDYCQKIIEAGIKKDLISLISHAESLSELNREEQKSFCLYLSEYFRKLYMIHLGIDILAESTTEQINKLRSYSQRIKPNIYPIIYRLLNKSIASLERNVNSKLIFNDLCNRFFLSL